MNQKNISRRDLLKWSLGAGLSTAMIESLGQMVSTPGWNQLLGGSSLMYPHWAVKDSFHLTQQLGRFGAAGQLSTLFQLQEAMAESANDGWSLITIKVFDQVHHPLLFALGQMNANGSDVLSASLNNQQHPATNKCNQNTADHLEREGIKNLATDQRFKNLRFNQWFAKRLQNGTYNGIPLNQTNAQHLGYENYLGAFPANVAIQVGLGVQPIPGYGVHQLGLAKLRAELSDLAHMAGYKGLVQSPLGITCFMMGNEYDNAGGSSTINQVFNGLNSQQKDNAEVIGRNLNAIVKNIGQSLNQGFGDFRDLKSGKNLTYLFDKLSVTSPQRRLALIESRNQVANAIKNMNKLAKQEFSPLLSNTGTLDEIISNKQALFVDDKKAYETIAARQEFVAQCAYVAEALNIGGQPYRNFSLFLNVNDLDGKNIDDPTNDSISFRANSLNYIEGMRQLAMGLNILAKAIAGKKAIVVLISDGGRTREMADGEGAAFSLLLGPKRQGYLDDALHANLDIFNSEVKADGKGPLQNLGSSTKELGWTTGDANWGLFENTGRRANAGEQTNSGDWQMGVLDFLSSVQGKPVMSPEFGRFVRFKRSA